MLNGRPREKQKLANAHVASVLAAEASGLPSISSAFGLATDLSKSLSSLSPARAAEDANVTLDVDDAVTELVVLERNDSSSDAVDRSLSSWSCCDSSAKACLIRALSCLAA